SQLSAIPNLAFFGQPPKCEIAHTSFRLAPPKSDMAKFIWRHTPPRPGGIGIFWTRNMEFQIVDKQLVVHDERRPTPLFHRRCECASRWAQCSHSPQYITG